MLSETKTGTWSDRRRAAILDAAVQVFLERGGGVTIDAIAARAQSSKATIYAHFTDKRGLFIAAVGTKIGSIAAEFQDLMPTLTLEDTGRGPAAAVEALVAFSHRWVELAEREDVVATIRLILAEAEQYPELLEQWNTQFGLSSVHLVAALERIESAGLTFPDRQRAANQLGLLIGGEAWIRLHLFREFDRAALEEALRANLELFARGYTSGREI